MGIRINNKALALFIGMNPHIDITPGILKDYINTATGTADIKLRRKSLAEFLLVQALKPLRKKKRIRDRSKV